MDNTNGETVTIPSWINAEFLEDVLSQERKRVSVVDFNVKSAVPKGDNYLSTLYRVVVQYHANKDQNDVSKSFLILKTLPPGELIQKFLSDLKGFEKEFKMYGKTLPAMYRIMKEKSSNGKLRPLSAKCLPTDLPNLIVLEDLQQLGYKMANRHAGLDLAHSRMTVRALARLHAGSAALYETDPTCMDLYGESFYTGDEVKREQLQLHFSINLNTLASIVEKWPGYEQYAEKIRAFIPTALDEMIKLVEPKKDSLNVLNHGDCWVNNMMFRYSETGEVEDIRFVDFQIARFSSPVLDLQYFFCTSLQDDIRFECREHLLEEYHAELVDTMKALDMNPEQFTLQQLKDEFEEKEMFGFLTTTTVLCAVLAEKSDAPDFSELTEKDLENGGANPMEKAFSGRRYREVFQSLLRHFDSKGIL